MPAFSLPMGCTPRTLLLLVWLLAAAQEDCETLKKPRHLSGATLKLVSRSGGFSTLMLAENVALVALLAGGFAQVVHFSDHVGKCC